MSGGGDVRIGISGWNYPAWRGSFYPPGLPHREELAYAAARLGSIELNATFYSLQRPDSFRRWRDATPPGFRFAVKGGRFITHLKRLRDVQSALGNFFASGLLTLQPKLGPFLWQLPPQLSFDAGLVRDFLTLLPRTAAQAERTAADHDDKLTGDRLQLSAADPRQALRHAVEVRHDSFRSAEFIALLEEFGVACVLADAAGTWPRIDVVTADFSYARLHGATELYASGYDDAALESWAGWVRDRAAAGLDVFLYFDNDVRARAPIDAVGLIDRVG